MNDLHSDAFVFFGATGDLAYKKIFPALQAMAKRGHLDVPIIGVAKSGWTLDQFRARARDSVERHGGLDPAAFAKLFSLLHYVDGDYHDGTTFRAIREQLGSAASPAYYLAIPPTLFPLVVDQLRQSGCTNGARVIVEKPFGRDRGSAQALNRTLFGCFDERTISVSTITSASGPCITCSSSGSPTPSWSRSGTETVWRACRSRWPKTSASRDAARSTRRPAPFATSFRIISSRF
jgi:glucose-6-phosphate 1-dehydrogenase